MNKAKKLAEILPIDSADMFYVYGHSDKLYGATPYVIGWRVLNKNKDILCWSLAALLNYIVVNLHVGVMLNDGRWELNGKGLIFCNEDLIDACYEMINKLHELNLL